MNNLPERTMVKKGAAEIGDIIKELKDARIKITKANTAAVNKEHDAIVEATCRLLISHLLTCSMLTMSDAKKLFLLLKRRVNKLIEDAHLARGSTMK